MQSGELMVVGTNHITRPLRGFPSKVHVRFKDEDLQPAPCDPGNVDFVEYEIHVSNTTHGGYVLLIRWSVSSVREIVWHAYY